jgi:L-histidine N-alpha-methyltransferase
VSNREFLERLMRVLKNGDDWSLWLGLGDQAEQLAQLTNDLKLPFSETGEGKHFASGFSYMGLESTLAWAKATSDPFYVVMKNGIETFQRRWAAVRAGLNDSPYHYLSLGPGTGEKDVLVLRDLESAHRARRYLPVDMSHEMLWLAIRQVLLNSPLPRNRITPIRLDFSRQDSVDSLRELLEQVASDEPVLFSLLGNTMANFMQDDQFLNRLLHLLRPQDRLLLEVATTEALNPELAGEAAREYAGTGTVREFVASALLHHTDLRIDMDSVLFYGQVENDRALMVMALYRNDTGRTIKVTLPDRTQIPFQARETIRLYMTRKYLRSRLVEQLATQGVRCLNEHYWGFPSMHASPRFGMDLLLLERRSKTEKVPATTADILWPELKERF